MPSGNVPQVATSLKKLIVRYDIGEYTGTTPNVDIINKTATEYTYTLSNGRVGDDSSANIIDQVGVSLYKWSLNGTEYNPSEIRTSTTNGIITYNTKSPYNGNVFNNIRLEFKDGKIIKATTTEHNELLNEIFDTDEGARYVGEFSLGFNPRIINPMGDILYDEKIMGSIHFTPGRCYEDCDNGNKSSIHWDLVLIQREDYGGGEIYFDDVLIRKDGKFVLESLKNLN